MLSIIGMRYHTGFTCLSDILRIIPLSDWRTSVNNPRHNTDHRVDESVHFEDIFNVILGEFRFHTIKMFTAFGCNNMSLSSFSWFLHMSWSDLDIQLEKVKKTKGAIFPISHEVIRPLPGTRVRIWYWLWPVQCLSISL